MRSQALDNPGMLKHFMQAQPLRRVFDEQLEDEVFGVLRDVGREREVNRRDSPVSLAVALRFKRRFPNDKFVAEDA